MSPSWASAPGSRTHGQTCGATSRELADDAIAIRIKRRRFVVLDGTLTMYLGEPPVRVGVQRGGLIHVRGEDAAPDRQLRNRGPAAVRLRIPSRRGSRRDSRFGHPAAPGARPLRAVSALLACAHMPR